VIDASDRQVQPKVTIVNDILDNIGASQKRIYIFNKIDQITAEEKIKLKELYSEHETFFVSATEKSNIDELKTLIITIASTL
jgi:50S ribosomal subunit-associated GTPase HflX